MRRVDLSSQGVALCGKPVDVSLGIAHHVDQTGRVTAADLTAAGDPVSGGQQQTGQQAHDRHPITPP